MEAGQTDRSCRLCKNMQSKIVRPARDKLLAAIVDHIFDYVTLTDLAGIIQFTGKSHQDLGFPLDYFLGKSLTDFVHPDDRPIMERAYHKFLREPTEHKVVLRALTANNSCVWLETVGQMIVDDETKHSWILLTSRNITDRKDAEDRLNQIESSYQGIFNTLSEAIYILDEHYRFIVVNRGAEQMYGYEQQEMVGKTPADVAAAGYNDMELIGRWMQNTMETGASSRFEFWACRKNGQIFPKEVIVNRGNYFGKTVLIATARDITEAKQHEEILKRNLREKNTLIQELYHRTKNNMQVISSIINLQSVKLESAGLQDVLATIDGRIRCMALVHEMLYKSMDLSHIDLRTYLERLAESVIKSCRCASCAIDCSVDGPAIMLLIDEAVPCGLVINELLTNSCKHAFKNRTRGSIRISIGNDNPTQLTIEYRDNGSGLPEDIDMDNPASLGLSMLRFLVEHQLEGTLRINSDQGLCFTISFPFNTYSTRV